ncbi:MAG: DNA alkylation repair protein [Verrucomicrobia bacterium]|nr:DNA alkylation repair protein [Verrucomicrobiota bacterium]
MITEKELVAEIEKEILSARSPSTPVLRAIRKNISRKIKPLDRQVIIEAALALILRNRIHRFIPYELVQNHPAAMETISWAEIEKLSQGMASWSEVDSFACFVSGPAWAAERVNDSKIKGWAKSSDRWRRRAALVSTLALNGRPPVRDSTKRTLEICQMLISDRDDMVVKAMSWALRRLGTVDPDAVRSFVDRHKGRLASLIVREVSRKLETGRKDGRKGFTAASAKESRSKS